MWERGIVGAMFLVAIGCGPGEPDKKIDPEENVADMESTDDGTPTPDATIADMGMDPIHDMAPPDPDMLADASGSAPEIFTPLTVDFRAVVPVDNTTRDTHWKVAEVSNIGTAPLTLSAIAVAPADSPFSISFPDPQNPLDVSLDIDTFPTSIEPDGVIPIRVFFNPIDTDPASAQLEISSNDPDQPEKTVQLRGNHQSPCVELSEEVLIDFGAASTAGTTPRTVIASNCSINSALTITDIEVCTDQPDGTCSATDTTFSLTTSLSTPATIAATASASFTVGFTPTDTSASTGMLTVTSNDPAKSTLEVPLQGSGVNNQCPVAVAEARPEGTVTWIDTLTVAPMTSIELQGTGSSDPDGTVAGYEWTLIQRPTGSTTRITPMRDVASPRLFVDVAGTYVVELVVTDDMGTQSCAAPELVTINAVPDTDMYIELTWDTPADPDQTDTFGTDLDLHFVHPNGEWNETPWDIYWLNPTSDWGNPGPDDDPVLVIDDTDGAGPEAIRFDSPEAGLVYSIGAYYFADNGYGPSYATLRVYVNGLLDYEYANQFLAAAGTFWLAATITWPTTVTAVNQVSQGFPPP